MTIATDTDPSNVRADIGTGSGVRSDGRSAHPRTPARPGALSVVRSELIKLRSTRSPWWCAALALVIPMGFGMLITADTGEGSSIFATMAGMRFAGAVIAVFAALAVTSEYRFGTIRTTFQAQPSRTRVLWTKVSVVAALAFVIGQVAAFATLAVSQFFDTAKVLVLDSADDWRLVAGYGLVYALVSVIAVAVGALVRHPAGAVSALLVWSLALENLVNLIPGIGADIYRVLPFINATLFAGDPAVVGVVDPLSTLGSLGVLAASAVALLGAATVVVNRRDA